MHMLVVMCIYIILAVSYNLLIGYTGLFSIAHAAFYGIGAYVAGGISVYLGLNFFVEVFLALIVAGLASVLLAILALRLSQDYLVIGSFGFVVIVNSIFLNLESVTLGPSGLPGIAQPVIFGFTFSSLNSYFGLVVIITTFCYLACWRLVSSPFGRVLKAIREDEVAAASLGKDIVRFKVLIFVIAGVMAGLAGLLYAHYYTFISPYTFTVHESIYILSLVIVGGPGTLTGPVVGTVILVAVPTILKFVGIPGHLGAPIRNMLYGLLLILFMMFRPSGLMGKRKGGLSMWESTKIH